MLPNFFILGAAKSGTTTLCSLLAQHPDVYMSPVKEPRFFALEGQRPNFVGPGDHHANAEAVVERAAYERLFDGVHRQRAVGEASTLYLFSPVAPQRIREAVPHARLIAILRHPAERAFSNYLHLVRDGRETRPFEEALRMESEREAMNWSRFWLLRQTGFYYEQLRRYFALFDPAQIRVFLYDDLRDDALAVAAEGYRFLGVDDAFVPNRVGRQNASGAPKHKLLHELIFKRDSPAKRALRPLRPMLPTRLRQTITAVERQSFTRLEMPTASRTALTDAYRDDILRLQDLIERDLTHWLS